MSYDLNGGDESVEDVLEIDLEERPFSLSGGVLKVSGSKAISFVDFEDVNLLNSPPFPSSARLLR